jgi:CDP-glucose 4,6-dehydratase
MGSRAAEVAQLKEFYNGKTVLLTGVHGFKGSWFALLLHELGANVVGVGLPATDGLLFPLLRMEELGITAIELDVRDRALVHLTQTVNPDVVFHLAAQPIVSVGYADPYLTYSSNVLGVVNVLDGVRALQKHVSVINVTTDKVYRNIEKPEAYLEDDELMGNDPYSSSKSCSELVTYAYRHSFFQNTEGPEGKLVSTCRAGNVIGGGDFALNRIIPDMVRALSEKKPVAIRNFDSIRPYEHVLDALYAYALLAAKQWDDSTLVGAYNIGPNDESVMVTRELTNYFQKHTELKVLDESGGRKFEEAHLLSLDSGKFRSRLNWAPHWATKEEMLQQTLAWYLKWLEGTHDMTEVTLTQIREFFND